MLIRSFAAAGMIVAAVTGPALAEDASSRLTIYSNGLALVDEARSIPAGPSTDIRINGVAPQMIADSLRVDLSGKARVQEIALDTDILSQQSLLEHHVGKTVRVARVNPATGEESYETAEILSVRGGLVLRINGRIETSVPGRLIFDSVPDDLLAEPNLSVRLAAPLDSETDARVAYLTNGMRWETVYTAVLNGAHDEMDLEGWAKINNQSGLDFEGASVSVVAGDVARTSSPRAGKILMRAETAALAADAPAANIAPQELSAFHLYQIPGDVTLRDKATKQFYLLGADEVAAKRILEFRSGAQVFGRVRGSSRPQPVRQRIEVANIGKNALGVPLPAGVVRAYVRDSAGALRFIGEDRTGNVPAGGDLRLNLGRAFDVTVLRKQTDFRRLGDRVSEAAFNLTVKNVGTKSAEVRMVEDIPGDWEILEQSSESVQDGPSAVWTIDVPAEGAVELSYRVRVRR